MRIHSVINAQDDKLDTPLHAAVLNNSTKSIEYLLERGANAAKRNKCGMCPMHVAVEQNTLKSLATLLNCKVCFNVKKCKF